MTARKLQIERHLQTTMVACVLGVCSWGAHTLYQTALNVREVQTQMTDIKYTLQEMRANGKEDNESEVARMADHERRISLVELKILGYAK